MQSCVHESHFGHGQRFNDHNRQARHPGDALNAASAHVDFVSRSIDILRRQLWIHLRFRDMEMDVGRFWNACFASIYWALSFTGISSLVVSERSKTTSSENSATSDAS